MAGHFCIKQLLPLGTHPVDVEALRRVQSLLDHALALGAVSEFNDGLGHGVGVEGLDQSAIPAIFNEPACHGVGIKNDRNGGVALRFDQSVGKALEGGCHEEDGGAAIVFIGYLTPVKSDS